MDASGYGRAFGEAINLLVILAIFGVVVGVVLVCGLVGFVIGGIVALATWSVAPLFTGCGIGLAIGAVLCAAYGALQLALNRMGRP